MPLSESLFATCTARRKNYPPEQLECAVGMVLSGAMSATQASKVYGVPRRTVGDRVARKMKRQNFEET